MDLKDIKELIALMRRNELSEFEMETEGFRIKLKKGGDPVITQAPACRAPQPAAAAPAAPAAAEAKPQGREDHLADGGDVLCRGHRPRQRPMSRWARR